MRIKRRELTREIVISTLVDDLKPLVYVKAFWEGGAAAFDRIDEWSDIDIYLIVDDDKVRETFRIVERSLKSLSPIQQKFEVSHPSQLKIYQAFYRLKNANRYLLIDLAILNPSSPEKFLQPEIHGNVIFYINKPPKVKIPHLKKTALIKKLHESRKKLDARFKMFNIFIQKEINRGNFLEAIDLYYTFTLSTLVKILRIKHRPFHYDYKMRYIHQDLPLQMIEKLKNFAFIENEKDLQEKYQKATTWILELLDDKNVSNY